MVEIREAQHQELAQTLLLYTYLHGNPMPIINEEIRVLWDTMVKDPNHHIIVGVSQDEIIASCVLMIIPNLTHTQRPYALVENVVTHPAYRKRGCGTRILEYAKEMAVGQSCYKIMLMTAPGRNPHGIFISGQVTTGRIKQRLCSGSRIGYARISPRAWMQR